MRVSLSSHFTFRNIFRQVLTPILMMVFISLYGIVDGVFIANFDSQEAFAGVNLIFPLIMIVGGLGFMFGSGGSALASKLLGEKNRDEANKVFTMIVIVTFCVGLIASIGGFFLVEPFAIAMSKITTDCTQEMIDKAIIYGRVLMCGQSLYMIQNLFQNFFVVDEKQNLCFFFTLGAGITNMVFDALFIAVFKWGVVGAAIATIMGFCVASIGPIIYFLTHKNGVITFVKTKINWKHIGKSCTNGVSDFIFNISSSTVAVLYNIQLLKYFGENGVSAYGAVMYISFIFVAVFIGYSIGIGPVIGYNYGAKNHDELHNVISKSSMLIGIASFIMLLAGGVFAEPLAKLFLDGDPEVMKLCAKAMRIYSVSFIMSGFSIFITSMFTSLNNGLISGLISILRTLVYQIIAVFLLPPIFGGNGILWAVVVAEALALVTAIICVFISKKKYQY